MAMKPEDRWAILNHTFDAYQEYRKTSEGLSYDDLLYVSNFKGGNASIGDSRKEVDKKLSEFYQPHLNAIKESFGTSKLQDLSSKECKDLSNQATAFVLLTKVPDYKIRGFGVSYASALLAMHFPDLLPVLDRRVLAGAGIEEGKVAMSKKGGQVKQIETHYFALIEKMSFTLKKSSALSLRDLDKDWFIKASAVAI